MVAAFLGGSHATGRADAYSDLDLYLITTDAAYDEFFAGREEFVRRLGRPVFLEVFDEVYYQADRPILAASLELLWTEVAQIRIGADIGGGVHIVTIDKDVCASHM